MSELEIQYDIDIKFECGIFIEELDIVALFGNLIDNAIEDVQEWIREIRKFVYIVIKLRNLLH